MSINDLLVANNFDLKCNTITAAGGHSVGWQTGASAVDPVFIASGATAIGTGSVSIGKDAAVAGSGGVAIGGTANASGTNNAVAVGSDSIAAGVASVALGREANAENSYGIALGYLTHAPATQDISIGAGAGNTDAAGTGVVRLAAIPNPVAETTSEGSHTLPITINGTAYKILLTT